MQGVTQEKILDISYTTGLIERKRMIMPGDLLFAICNGTIQGDSSYNDFAMLIDYNTGKSVTKQAVAKKIKHQCKIFIQEIVKIILENKFVNVMPLRPAPEVFLLFIFACARINLSFVMTTGK